jgi:exosome complex RNA-binding protein Csl4
VKIIQLVRCLFGKHLHNTRISRDDAGVVRSRCQGCGRRMVRVEEGRHRTWQIEKKGRSGVT